MTAYTINIISDTVCPWCYIGHLRLSTAIKTHLTHHPTDTFTTRWLPYQLNPYHPRGEEHSVGKREYYSSKFGERQAQAIFARLTAAGKESGVEFRFGGRTGNTFDSHRVIEFARRIKGLEMQGKVVEELFADYFEKERDITSHDVLVGAAERAGLNGREVREMLKGDDCGDVVSKEVTQAKEDGVSGVPHFTIQGRYEVSGGQEPAAFLQIFGRIKKGEEEGKVEALI